MVEAAGVEPASDTAPGSLSTRVVSDLGLDRCTPGDGITSIQPASVFHPAQRARTGRQPSEGDAPFGADGEPLGDSRPQSGGNSVVGANCLAFHRLTGLVGSRRASGPSSGTVESRYAPTLSMCHKLPHKNTTFHACPVGIRDLPALMNTLLFQSKLEQCYT